MKKKKKESVWDMSIALSSLRCLLFKYEWSRNNIWLHSIPLGSGNISFYVGHSALQLETKLAIKLLKLVFSQPTHKINVSNKSKLEKKSFLLVPVNCKFNLMGGRDGCTKIVYVRHSDFCQSGRRYTKSSIYMLFLRWNFKKLI